MLGIVIATHGRLAEGFKDAADTVLGGTQNVEAVGLYPGQDITEFYKQVEEKIKQVNKGSGVIVFTDLVSASPYTQAQRAISLLEDKSNIAVIGNTSFPMLVEALNAQIIESSFEDALNDVLNVANLTVEAWTYEEPEASDDDDDF